MNRFRLTIVTSARNYEHIEQTQSSFSEYRVIIEEIMLKEDFLRVGIEGDNLVVIPTSKVVSFQIIDIAKEKARKDRIAKTFGR